MTDEKLEEFDSFRNTSPSLTTLQLYSQLMRLSPIIS